MAKAGARAVLLEQDRRLAEAFPRNQHKERAWFNTLNEAYVKARYSKHYEISEEALSWLGERQCCSTWSRQFAPSIWKS